MALGISCVFSISACWAAITFLANSSTSGSSPRSMTARAIGMAASWCGIMSLIEELVVLVGGQLAQVVDLLRSGHPRHGAVHGVPHPGHRFFGSRWRQAPHGEPTLHLADPGLLGEGDVRGEGADLRVVGPVAYDLGHLDGLGVVDHHVPGEARSRRVVGGRLAGEVQPESERRRGENDEGQDHDEGTNRVRRYAPWVSGLGLGRRVSLDEGQER